MKIKFDKIKRILRQRGMTLEDLAKIMKLKSKQGAWYRIKNAKSFRLVEATAKALGVKVKDII